MPMQVARVTLSTKKVVLLKILEIKDTELAAQEVAPRANGDANVLQILMSKALVKNLLVQIDGKPVSLTEREDMDSLFKIGEYQQLLQAVKQMSGGDEAEKKPQIELVSHGES